jgi:hypothetical protein
MQPVTHPWPAAPVRERSVPGQIVFALGIVGGLISLVGFRGLAALAAVWYTSVVVRTWRWHVANGRAITLHVFITRILTTRVDMTAEQARERQGRRNNNCW